jgi:hypothetical protein
LAGWFICDLELTCSLLDDQMHFLEALLDGGVVLEKVVGGLLLTMIEFIDLVFEG